MLTGETWEQTLRTAWDRLRHRIEVLKDFDFAHEHTLQFHFAWEVARLHRFDDSLTVRFEVWCGVDPDGDSIYLDLLLWKDPAFKIAVEMKAPLKKRTGSPSATTQYRRDFYKDLHRLTHLVENGWEGIRRGMFLAVVNERGYVVRNRQRVNEPYATYHGTQILAGTMIPVCPGPNGCEYDLRMPGNPFVWNWSLESIGGHVQPSSGMAHFWLEPIPVYPRQALT